VLRSAGLSNLKGEVAMRISSQRHQQNREPGEPFTPWSAGRGLIGWFLVALATTVVGGISVRNVAGVEPIGFLQCLVVLGIVIVVHILAEHLLLDGGPLNAPRVLTFSAGVVVVLRAGHGVANRLGMPEAEFWTAFVIELDGAVLLIASVQIFQILSGPTTHLVVERGFQFAAFVSRLVSAVRERLKAARRRPGAGRRG
jgi:hypothetical protein